MATTSLAPQPVRETVFDRRLGRLRPIVGDPVLSSAHLDWRGYLFEQHSVPCLEPSEVIWMNHVLFLLLSAPATIEWKEGDDFVPYRMLPGQITLTPAQTLSSIRCAEPLEYLFISLDPTFLLMSCSNLADLREVELRPARCFEDRFIEGVCFALQSEVKSGGFSGRLYSEALAASLAVHLMVKFSARRTAPPNGNGNAVSQPVRRAIQHMHEHLGEELSLADIASSAGLSPFHFARLFKQSTGFSPHQFVVHQRIEEAKRLLLQGDLPLSSVGTQVGFFDQSHFTKHFKRLAGVTPKEFVRRCAANPRPNRRHRVNGIASLEETE